VAGDRLIGHSVQQATGDRNPAGYGRLSPVACRLSNGSQGRPQRRRGTRSEPPRIASQMTLMAPMLATAPQPFAA
jgi:hypothetical protein